MDAKSKNSPIQTRRTMRNRNAESADKSATKEGDQIAVAPTVTVAFAKAELLKAKSEMNMYKLRVENLEEKVEALTKERDFLRTQLSDERRRGNFRRNPILSQTQNRIALIPLWRRRKRKLRKKKKGKKAKKEKKSKKEGTHHYRQRGM
uniref:uncharacterized protein LOC109958735 isoform X2 n=1 Tax=Monopterus albus TaxID=43700 RepID=UPI0009B42BEE|nr:uncharacterized protein LOC109958735 isoform X2 [Monopterus albus]